MSSWPPPGQPGQNPGDQPWGTPGGQPPYGPPPAAQPHYGQPTYGQPAHGQAPYGQPPYGQAPYGQAPYGQAPYGGYPVAPNPYGQYSGPGTPAGMGSRLLARIIDGVIIGVPAAIIIGILIAALVKNSTCTTDFDGTRTCTADGGSVAGLLIGYVLIGLAGLFYELYFVGLKGATVGKRVMGVRVQDSVTGQPIGMGRAFVRYLVLAVTGSLCFIGYFSPFFDSPPGGRYQGWHDKAANDVVVTTK